MAAAFSRAAAFPLLFLRQRRRACSGEQRQGQGRRHCDLHLCAFCEPDFGLSPSSIAARFGVTV
jgi:hypothetical protein